MKETPKPPKSLAQAVRQEVNFDPSNPEHMEIARILFALEDKPHRVETDEEKDQQERYNQDVAKRRTLSIRFRLEAPYHDIRTMVLAKVFKWAIEIHKRGILYNVHILPVQPKTVTKI